MTDDERIEAAVAAGDVDGALKLLARRRMRAPDDPAGFVRAIALLEQAGRREDAAALRAAGMKRARVAAALGPEPDAPARVARAQALAAAGDAAAAKAEISAAAARFPRDVRVLAGRGYLLRKLGDRQSEATAWAALRAAFPDVPDGWVHGAALARDAGNFASAESLMVQGLARQPRNYPLLAAHAYLAEARGLTVEARARWTRAAEAAADRTEAEAALARLGQAG